MLVSDMRPQDWPPDPERDIIQPKWNGIRAIGDYAIKQTRQGKKEGRVRILTRGGNDYTDSFPELAAQLPDALRGNEAVVDGEIIRIFGRHGEHNHNTVRKRGGRLVYYVFDLLELHRDPIINKPWEERNEMLHDLLVPQDNIQETPSFRTIEEWAEAMAGWKDPEGVVIKDIHSIYVPGGRRQTWQRVKFKKDPSHRRR